MLKYNKYALWQRDRTMKIERVDDNTVKCYISVEEMAQYQIEYTDFLSRTDKAQQLMRDIIKQAHDEVGYIPPKYAFEMQIMMVPNQGMVLTFTEKDPIDFTNKENVEAFLANLKEFVNRLIQHKEKLEQGKAANAKLPGAEGLIGKGNPAGDVPAGKERPIRIKEIIFAFDTITSVMDYAEALPSGFKLQSALYKMDDVYYLYLKQGSENYENFRRAIAQGVEFGRHFTDGEGCDEMLKEHGECLIESRALRHLRGEK